MAIRKNSLGVAEIKKDSLECTEMFFWKCPDVLVWGWREEFSELSLRCWDKMWPEEDASEVSLIGFWDSHPSLREEQSRSLPGKAKELISPSLPLSLSHSLSPYVCVCIQWCYCSFISLVMMKHPDLKQFRGKYFYLAYSSRLQTIISSKLRK